MALDTQDKRDSAIHVSLPWRMRLPAPGTLTTADRLHVAFLYRGIAAGGQAVTGPYYIDSSQFAIAGSLRGQMAAAGSVAGQCAIAGSLVGDEV